MAGPVTSAAAQQTVQTTQPVGIGERDDARTRVQEEFESEETRPSGTSAAESQETETRNNGQDDENVVQQSNPNDFEALVAQGTERGSVVDIEV